MTRFLTLRGLVLLAAITVAIGIAVFLTLRGWVLLAALTVAIGIIAVWIMAGQ